MPTHSERERERERERGRGVKGSVAEFALVSTFHLSSPLENDVPLVENNPNLAPYQNGGSKQPKQGDVDLGAPR